MSEKCLLFQYMGPLLESRKRCEILTSKIHSWEVRRLGYLCLLRLEGRPWENAHSCFLLPTVHRLLQNGSQKILVPVMSRASGLVRTVWSREALNLCLKLCERDTAMFLNSLELQQAGLNLLSLCWFQVTCAAEISTIWPQLDHFHFPPLRLFGHKDLPLHNCCRL